MPGTSEKPTSRRQASKQAPYELIRVSDKVCKVVMRDSKVFMGIVGGEQYCRARATELGFKLSN